MKEKRDQVLHFRLTKSEKAELINKVDGNLSDWIRELVLSGKPKKTRKAKPVNKELLYELNRIGVNINQIAKRLNQFDDLEKIDVILSLQSIEESMKELREIYK